MKHRKPNRIKASTSLTLAGAAAVVTLLSAPANAAPADPGAVPADQQQPDSTPTTQPPAPESPKTDATPAPEQARPEDTQPGVTTPTVPTPDNTKPTQTPQPQGATQPEGNTPKTDQNTPKSDPTVEPAGNTPKRATQPGVTVPRVAPLPVPGQATPAGNVETPSTPGTATPGASTPGTATPAQQPNQSVTPGQSVTPNQPNTAQPAGTGTQQEPDIDTMTGQSTTPGATEKPRWQSPAVDTAPAAPVVEMSGPHTEFGVNLDGGALLPGWAANTHHFSNLDGYVGTIGYTTPTGLGEAGAALDFTTVNQIKVTAFAGTGADNDRKIEFVLDTTAANKAKTDGENFIRLLPGGATVLDAAAQIGKLPQGDQPSQSIDVGGVTAQVAGSVQY